MAIKYNMIKQRLRIQKEKSPRKGTRKRNRAEIHSLPAQEFCKNTELEGIDYTQNLYKREQV